jgi:hypothetical protein
MFAILTILKHCMHLVAPQSHWAQRLKALLVEFPDIPLKSMGFPDNWTENFFWSFPRERLERRRRPYTLRRKMYRHFDC